LRSGFVVGLLALGLVDIACAPRTKVVVVPPGAQAASYLTAGLSRMVIEVSPVEGRAPDPQALDLLVQRILERCKKPGGVQVVVDPEVPLSSIVGTATVAAVTTHDYSIGELGSVEAQTRLVMPPADAAYLHVVYLDGELGGTPTTLGLAFKPGAVAMFKDALRTLIVEPVQGEVEGSVLVHEFGHQMGLVNQGTPLTVDHEDGQHLGHCSNPQCVMFWELETRARPGGAIEIPPDDYDAACKSDLEAAGGN
jgi:hypothetical protein